LLVAISCFYAPGLPSTQAQGAMLKLHDIQGSGATSPFAGQTITTSGIVTAIKSDGFFIQEPDATADDDANTSEAVFVFTSSAPPAAVAVGNAVTVTGTVAEFKPASDPLSLPLTEISNSPTVTLLTTGNALPEPVTITADDASPTGPIDQLERFEAMRVRVDFFQVVAPTGGTVDERNATASSNGVFWGVVGGIPRPFREPGIDVLAPLPLGALLSIPRFDSNPERIRVDSSGQRGTSPLDVTTSDRLFNFVGVLDYQARAYTILPDAASFDIPPRLFTIPPLPPSVIEFTVASFNLGRFYDTTDNPATSDVVLTQEAFDRRLNKAAHAVAFMSAPDIIGVEEVENLKTLQALADKINSQGSGRGLPNPSYVTALVEGNDASGINVGFLVNSSRVTLVSAVQFGKDATFTNPTNGQQEILNDRPPLRLKAIVASPFGQSVPVTVIVNHLQSLSGIDDANDGARVRAKRRAQAEFLATLLQAEQSQPDANVIVVGDFNAFEFNDGYVDVMGTIKGTPASADQVVLPSSDLVDPDFVDITTEQVTPGERYSFVFDSNAQALDHILVNQNFHSRVSHVTYAHFNADVPESLRNDASRPERSSDHDVPIAYFNVVPVGHDLSLTKTGAPEAVRTHEQITYTITATNNGTSAAPEVLVIDPMGFGTSFVSVTTTQGICTPPSLGDRGTVVCRLSELPAGATARITLIARAELVSQLPVHITNTALASAFIDEKYNQVLVETTNLVLPTPAILSASVSGKQLIVEGLNFVQGAVIEINGKPQATKTKAVELGSATLIAKKGGKKIAPGATVTLTVVNPDGVRSAPFSFTRPAP
jgi:conserved repeat domain